MRNLWLILACAVSTSATAQGVCFRPGGEALAVCLGRAADLQVLALCASVIENFNHDVDDWVKCRLETVDQEHRDRRQLVLDQAAMLKNRTPEMLKTRALMR